MIYETIEDMKKDLPWLNNLFNSSYLDNIVDRTIYVKFKDSKGYENCITYNNPSCDDFFSGVYEHLLIKDSPTNIRLEGMVDYKS